MPYFNNPYAGMNPYGGYQQMPNTYQQPMQRQEIVHVNGQAGANAYQMAPNSNILLLDDTAPIIWLAQTDGAGYKTVTPYDITPHQEKRIDVDSLELRIKKLEDMMYGQSNTTKTEPAQRTTTNE